MQKTVFFNLHSDKKVKKIRNKLDHVSFSSEFEEILDKCNLHTVICQGNTSQTGESFHAFVKAINLKKEKINKLFIVDTKFLFRHYNNYVQEEFDSNWRANNNFYLNELDVPYELISWKKLIENENYQEYYNQVNNLLTVDKEFIDIFEKEILKFEKKYGREEAISYLKEDCAGSLLIGKYVTHPGNINATIQYCIKKLLPESMKFIKYRFRYKQERVQKQPELYERVVKIVDGIPIEKMELFLVKLHQFVNNFLDKDIKLEKPNERNNTNFFM
jgi:hypothetical protein